MDDDIIWTIKDEPSKPKKPPDLQIKDDPDIIQLDDEKMDGEEDVNFWHEKVRKKYFNQHIPPKSEDKLIDMMECYIRDLESSVEYLKHLKSLKLTLLKHIKFIETSFGKVGFSKTEKYLDIMEDVAKHYCDKVTEFVMQTKKDQNMHRNEVKKMVRVECRRIKSLLRSCLVRRLERILHVLMKVKISADSQPCREMWSNIFGHFLTKVEQETTEENIIRGYIIFQRWKSIRKPEEARFIDTVMFNLYQKTPESLTKMQLLKRIVGTTSQSPNDPLNLVRDMVLKYFCYFKHKRKEQDKNIFEDGLRLSPRRPRYVDWEVLEEEDFTGAYNKKWQKEIQQSVVNLGVKSESVVGSIDEDDDVEIVSDQRQVTIVLDDDTEDSVQCTLSKVSPPPKTAIDIDNPPSITLPTKSIGPNSGSPERNIYKTVSSEMSRNSPNIIDAFDNFPRPERVYSVSISEASNISSPSFESIDVGELKLFFSKKTSRDLDIYINKIQSPIEKGQMDHEKMCVDLEENIILGLEHSTKTSSEIEGDPEKLTLHPPDITQEIENTPYQNNQETHGYQNMRTFYSEFAGEVSGSIDASSPSIVPFNSSTIGLNKALPVSNVPVTTLNQSKTASSSSKTDYRSHLNKTLPVPNVNTISLHETATAASLKETLTLLSNPTTFSNNPAASNSNNLAVSLSRPMPLSNFITPSFKEALPISINLDAPSDNIEPDEQPYNIMLFSSGNMSLSSDVVHHHDEEPPHSGSQPFSPDTSPDLRVEMLSPDVNSPTPCIREAILQNHSSDASPKDSLGEFDPPNGSETKSLGYLAINNKKEVGISSAIEAKSKVRARRRRSAENYQNSGIKYAEETIEVISQPILPENTLRKEMSQSLVPSETTTAQETNYTPVYSSASAIRYLQDQNIPNDYDIPQSRNDIRKPQNGVLESSSYIHLSDRFFDQSYQPISTGFVADGGHLSQSPSLVTYMRDESQSATGYIFKPPHKPYLHHISHSLSQSKKCIKAKGNHCQYPELCINHKKLHKTSHHSFSQSKRLLCRQDSDFVQEKPHKIYGKHISRCMDDNLSQSKTLISQSERILCRSKSDTFKENCNHESESFDNHKKSHKTYRKPVPQVMDRRLLQSRKPIAQSDRILYRDDSDIVQESDNLFCDSFDSHENLHKTYDKSISPCIYQSSSQSLELKSLNNHNKLNKKYCKPISQGTDHSLSPSKTQQPQSESDSDIGEENHSYHTYDKPILQCIDGSLSKSNELISLSEINLFGTHPDVARKSKAKEIHCEDSDLLDCLNGPLLNVINNVENPDDHWNLWSMNDENTACDDKNPQGQVSVIPSSHQRSIQAPCTKVSKSSLKKVAGEENGADNRKMVNFEEPDTALLCNLPLGNLDPNSIIKFHKQVKSAKVMKEKQEDSLHLTQILDFSDFTKGEKKMTNKCKEQFKVDWLPKKSFLGDKLKQKNSLDYRNGHEVTENTKKRSYVKDGTLSNAKKLAVADNVARRESRLAYEHIAPRNFMDDFPDISQRGRLRKRPQSKDYNEFTKSHYSASSSGSCFTKSKS